MPAICILAYYFGSTLRSFLVAPQLSLQAPQMACPGASTREARQTEPGALSESAVQRRSSAAAGAHVGRPLAFRVHNAPYHLLHRIQLPPQAEWEGACSHHAKGLCRLRSQPGARAPTRASGRSADGKQQCRQSPTRRAEPFRLPCAGLASLPLRAITDGTSGCRTSVATVPTDVS